MINDNERIGESKFKDSESENPLIFQIFIPLNKATDYYKKVYGVKE